LSNQYRFLTHWRLKAGIAEVSEILDDPLGLARWWPSVYLEVRELEPGDPVTHVGRYIELYTKGWLPYTLRWTLRVTEPITDAGYALTATGDLIGAGRWTFEQDGPEVVITYDWQVSARKPLLRRLTWLMRPVFAANHRWAMARGEESLRLELRRRRAASVADRRRVPAPPPATFRWSIGRRHA
jgi:hypothetical protein